jgi:hypothetical protein
MKPRIYSSITSEIFVHYYIWILGSSSGLELSSYFELFLWLTLTKVISATFTWIHNRCECSHHHKYASSMPAKVIYFLDCQCASSLMLSLSIYCISLLIICTREHINTLTYFTHLTYLSFLLFYKTECL